MAPSTQVDISEIKDKVRLLKMMWTNMKPASFFQNMEFMAPQFGSHEEALKAINKGYIDYYNGICIKTNLSSNVADFRLYDRDSTATGAYIVQKILETQDE